MDTPAIRTATADDIPAILDLWLTADATPSATDSAEALRHAVERATAVLVAADGARIVGTLIAGFDGWRGNLYRLAVHPEYRRRGIATRVLREGEARLRSAGAQRITALVEREHDWAVAFWRAAGYRDDEGMARYVRNLSD